MKKILKTIAFGIALGASVFFVPFIFKLMLAIMLIGFMLKMVFERKHRRFANRFDTFHQYNAAIVPIDNQWHRPTIQGNGLVNHVNVH